MQLALQSVQLGELAADVLQLGFQNGYLARFVVPPAVQLLFQGIGGLCIRGILLAGGDEGGDAALQSGVLGNGYAGLADKGAALVNLPADAQQRLAAVLARQTGETVAGPGVKGLEIAHGGGLAAGGPCQGQLVGSRTAVQTPAHGGAVPGGVTVFVRDEASLVSLPAVDAVEHGQEKGAPGGLACLVGGLNDIQAILQLQRAALQLAEGGGHAMDQQNDHSHIHIKYITGVL